MLKVLKNIPPKHYYNCHPKRRGNAYQKLTNLLGYEVVEEKNNNWLDFPKFISLNEFPLQLTYNYRTYNKCKDILRKLILLYN